jgi:hypothetical protein
MAASEALRAHERVQQVDEQSYRGQERDDVVHGHNRSQTFTKYQHAISEPTPTARNAMSSSMVSLVNEKHEVSERLEGAAEP